MTTCFLQSSAEVAGKFLEIVGKQSHLSVIQNKFQVFKKVKKANRRSSYSHLSDKMCSVHTNYKQPKELKKNSK